MWKKHWWKSSHKQCRKCGKYNAEKLVKETENWFYWCCKYCGFKRRHKRSWVIWKMGKDGKTFLKNQDDKKFREVELRITPNSISIINSQNKLL